MFASSVQDTTDARHPGSTGIVILEMGKWVQLYMWVMLAMEGSRQAEMKGRVLR